MRLLVASIVWFVIALPALAQTIEIKEPYSIHDDNDALTDGACKREAVKRLSEKAEGLEKVAFAMPTYWKSNIQNVEFFLYSDVTFYSSFGDVDGSVLCVTAPNHNLFVEMMFEFEESGLAGFRSFIPGKTPEETKRVTYVDQNSTQMIGTK